MVSLPITQANDRGSANRVGGELEGNGQKTPYQQMTADDSAGQTLTAPLPFP
jgi:hypothetical protein